MNNAIMKVYGRGGAVESVYSPAYAETVKGSAFALFARDFGVLSDQLAGWRELGFDTPGLIGVVVERPEPFVIPRILFHMNSPKAAATFAAFHLGLPSDLQVLVLKPGEIAVTYIPGEE